jgi:hypothetical protein
VLERAGPGDAIPYTFDVPAGELNGHPRGTRLSSEEGIDRIGGFFGFIRSQIA